MKIPILSDIERLINEHGSAVILKERLALAAEQYVSLEKKLSASAIREKQLQSENKSLRLDLDQAQIKIRDLEKQLSQEVKAATAKYNEQAKKRAKGYSVR